MNYIFLIISLLILIPFTVSILNFKYLDKSLKIISILLGIGFIFNLTDIILVFNKKPSVPLFHIYTIIEYLLISSYFYYLTQKKYFKKIIQIIIGVFLGGVILNKMFLEPIDKIDNYTLTLESILLLIQSSIYLTEYLSDNLIIKIRDYRFLLTIGFMIYFGSNLFVFALSNEFSIWIVHNILLVLLWSIFTLSFIWQRYQTKSGG